MKEIYKRLRKGAIGLLLGGAVILVVAAVIFMLYDGMFVIDYLTTKDDIYWTDSKEIEAEDCFAAEIQMLYDWYGSDDEGYYYIMPTADDTYMGVFVYNKDKAVADKLVEESQAYIFGETTEFPTTVLTGRGYVYEMSSKERQYFAEWFQYAGFDQTVIDGLCYKTYAIEPFHEIYFSGNVYMIVTFMGLVGIVMILYFLSGLYKRKFKSIIKKQGILESELTNDMAYATDYDNVSVGRKYTITYGTSPRIVVNSKLVWMYVAITTTKHTTYGIPTGTTQSYAVFFVSDDKSQYQVAVKSEADGRQIIDAVMKVAPQAICGYSDELATMYKKDFNEMKRIVAERRNELGFSSGVNAMQDELDMVIAEAPTTQLTPEMAATNEPVLNEGDDSVAGD